MCPTSNGRVDLVELGLEAGDGERTGAEGRLDRQIN